MDDVLEDRRRTGDWWWATREFHCPVYRHCKPRSTKGIREDVFKSRAVQFEISKLIEESGRSREDVEQEARTILEQMGHEFTMKAVRFFGFVLSKTWKRIYQGIYVNQEGIETVRKLVPKYPVVLLPTHRSYVDFLVVSYAFFHYNMPVPVIAAGQDFLNMKLMGTLMRHAGAFYIRRSFGKDKLYWTLFMEYVKTHIVNGEAPLEFFIEGTRSRSAKSLNPKYGLFTAVLEPFFKAEVPDVILVPVSVSYDRTLEEILYAYELLGVPKPKETTRGLLKARKILDDDYGNVFVHLGEPISVREFCTNKIDRTVHNLGPRHLSAVTPAEHQIIQELAFQALKCHQNNLNVSPFVLIAAVLMTYVQKNVANISLQCLVNDTRWLLSLLSSMGHRINWNYDKDPVAVVKDHCIIHHNLIHITEEGMVQVLEIHSNSADVAEQLSGLTESTLRRAVSHILLSHYSNQLLHLIVLEGLIVLSLKAFGKNSSVTLERLYTEYQFLQKILQFEFIFLKEKTLEEFEKALAFLKMVETVYIDASGVISANQLSRVYNFLVEMLEPVIGTYVITCQVLLNPEVTKIPATSKGIARKVQEEIERLLTDHQQCQNTMLSLDTIGNAIAVLHNIGALKKEQGNGAALYQPVFEELYLTIKRLELYMDWLPLTINEPPNSIVPQTTRAKL